MNEKSRWFLSKNCLNFSLLGPPVLSSNWAKSYLHGWYSFSNGYRSTREESTKMQGFYTYIIWVINKHLSRISFLLRFHQETSIKKVLFSCLQSELFLKPAFSISSSHLLSIPDLWEYKMTVFSVRQRSHFFKPLGNGCPGFLIDHFIIKKEWKFIFLNYYS